MQTKQELYALGLAALGLLALGNGTAEAQTGTGDLPALKTGIPSVVVTALDKKPSTVAAKRKIAVAKTAALNNAVVAKAAAPTFTAAATQPGARRVSLDFVSADISEVLKALAMQSGINIVLATNGSSAGAGAAGGSGAIQDKITVSLKKVSFSEALDTVVNLSGYRYARIGDTYAVGPPEAVAALARGSSVGIQTSASIPFIFSDGASLKASIESAFPTLKGRVTVVTIGSEGKTGTLVSSPDAPAGGAPGAAPTDAAADASFVGSDSVNRVVPKGGVVNISAAPAEIDAVRSFIEATETALIDAPYREQVAQSKRFAGLSTEVYKIKYASAPDLIQVLQQLAPNVNVTPGPTQGFQSTSTGQSLTYTAAPIVTPGGLVSAGGTAPGAAATGGPANTSVTVTNRTLSLLLTGAPEELARAQDILGKIDVRSPQLIFEAKVVDINQEDLLSLGIQYPETKTGVNVGVGENGAAARPLLGSFGALYRTTVGFNANLFAAVNNNKGKVLSNPNLTALDGQTATAFIGDQIKYVTQIQQTPQGQTVTTETATVGITLKVTGRYSPDGTITLYVHPEVSAISGFLSISQGISLPQVSTRYVDTTVRVKDGETIAIGGLIRNNEVKNLQRIPLLSDIPFFGELFKFRNNTKQQSEIVVFITSRLAPD
ncbi:MAG: secretin N-terminal domain-containing protein [Armatimonadota bacterium]